MKDENTTIWRAWTTLRKNGEGFAAIGKYSGHFGSAEIFIAELDTEEKSAFEKENYTHKICVPSAGIGSACMVCGEVIYAKSLGHARHIMQSKSPVKYACANGWYKTPQAAARAAFIELKARQ